MVSVEEQKNWALEMSFQERRENFRLMTFCKAYKDKQILGFVIDLSKKGLKLLLNKKCDLTVNDNFNIEIQPPTEIKTDPISINLNVVWKKPDTTPLLSEIGCQFKDLSVQQEEYINFILK